MPRSQRTISRNRRRYRRRRHGQLDLDLPRHGGRRRGAGRKPNGARAGVSHRPRGRVTRHTPVHVTLKVADDLPNLRSPSLFSVVREAIYSYPTRHKGADHFGLRVIHFCVLRGHLHLIVEAESIQALARGMQGLTIRLAKQLNKALSRQGKVFVDRYDSHVLRTPSEARACLNYVLKNERRHARTRGQVYNTRWVDPCSSGDRFTGWEGIETTLPADDLPIGRPRSWLLKEGWMRVGGAGGGGPAPLRRRLSVSQVPGPRPRRAQRAQV